MVKKSAAAGKSKRKAKAKAKTSGVTAQLQKLKNSIKSDVAQLSKAFPKALAEMDKHIRSQMQGLKKARKPKGKGAKGKAAKGSSANLGALKKAIDNLKSQKKTLQGESRKFAALHKALSKSSAKKAGKSKKTAAKSKKVAAA